MCVCMCVFVCVCMCACVCGVCVCVCVCACVCCVVFNSIQFPFYIIFSELKFKQILKKLKRNSEIADMKVHQGIVQCSQICHYVVMVTLQCVVIMLLW